MQTWFIALALVFAGHPATKSSWRITHNKEGGYRVLFPGKTEKGTRKNVLGNKRRLVKEEFAIDTKGVGYLVTYYDYSADEIEIVTPDGIMKESRASVLRGDFFAKPKEVREVALGKYRGFAFTVHFKRDGASSEVHVRMYLVRNRAYALGVLVVGGRRPTPNEVQRFFDSFQLVSTKEGTGRDKGWEKIAPPRPAKGNAR